MGSDLLQVQVLAVVNVGYAHSHTLRRIDGPHRVHYHDTHSLTHRAIASTVPSLALSSRG